MSEETQAPTPSDSDSVTNGSTDLSRSDTYVVSQVVQKITDEPFLFIIAVIVLLVGFASVAANLGAADFRFVIVVIALLAFFSMVGYYLLKLRAEVRGPRPINDRPENTGHEDGAPSSMPMSSPLTSPLSVSSSYTSPPPTPTSSPTTSLPHSLVEALLTCRMMRDRDTRDSIVEKLDTNIKTTIRRNSNDRVDISNIISRCQDWPHGLQQLIDAVEFYEGDTPAMRNVRALVK
jgi:hypothetical protein